ncbi:hypothetical protein KSS87_011201 [Heliosperma pusillum]|nr:hypothetical protein KSS87_015536 [Heliosperma pusillum]KAH9619875.1 hypothetical protein KSS87_011201 [Heliosperma pusillum]
MKMERGNVIMNRREYELKLRFSDSLTRMID